MKSDHLPAVSRRQFLTTSTLLATSVLLSQASVIAVAEKKQQGKPALHFRHFPSTLHAYVWRNWSLVPAEKIAKVVNAKPAEISAIAASMGLKPQKSISEDQQQRSYLTVIRRNWHLLPREQLLELLGWSDEKLTFTLQEDDFFYIKLGSLKPDCEKITYSVSNETVKKRENLFLSIIKKEFPIGLPEAKEPLFYFVNELSTPPVEKLSPINSGFSPRFGYAYFALFGDPLLDTKIDPYPNGYLDRMAASGMDGTWLHIVLSKITPFP